MGGVIGDSTRGRTAPRRTRLSPAERRASIVAAATEVFARRGYQKAKMSEVAAAVGVTEPVVFQNFGTKAALYIVVLEHAGEHAREAFAHRPFHGLGARRKLEELLSPEHLEAMHTGEAHGVLFADAMGLVADPEIGDAARSAVGALAETFAALVAEGQADGELRPDLDPDAAAWSMLSLMASYFFRVAVMPDRARLEKGVSDLMLSALIGGDETSKEETSRKGKGIR